MFRYILGVNQEAVEIKMTSPVPVRVNPVENNLVDQEMCLWLGTPYESKEVGNFRNIQQFKGKYT